MLVGYLVILAAVVNCIKFKRANAQNFADLGIEKGRISVNGEATTQVLIDAGWYSFSYGKAGNTAYRSFAIANSNVVQLEVTSCFCPGNFFSVYDNGQPIMMTALPTNVLATVKRPDQLPTCSPRITDPNICVNSEFFSSGRVLLLPGCHNITIVANLSPFNGGTAFLRADTACPSPSNMGEPIPCCLSVGTCSTKIVA